MIRRFDQFTGTWFSTQRENTNHTPPPLGPAKTGGRSALQRLRRLLCIGDLPCSPPALPADGRTLPGARMVGGRQPLLLRAARQPPAIPGLPAADCRTDCQKTAGSLDRRRSGMRLRRRNNIANADALNGQAHPWATAAVNAISTRKSGLASRASTQARAGAQPGASQTSQTVFIAS